jgi:hypothetical protein
VRREAVLSFAGALRAYSLTWIDGSHLFRRKGITRQHFIYKADRVAAAGQVKHSGVEKRAPNTRLWRPGRGALAVGRLAVVPCWLQECCPAQINDSVLGKVRTRPRLVEDDPTDPAN